MWYFVTSTIPVLLFASWLKQLLSLCCYGVGVFFSILLCCWVLDRVFSLKTRLRFVQRYFIQFKDFQHFVSSLRQRVFHFQWCLAYFIWALSFSFKMFAFSIWTLNDSGPPKSSNAIWTYHSYESLLSLFREFAWIPWTSNPLYSR